jgi:hypothetical protein
MTREQDVLRAFNDRRIPITKSAVAALAPHVQGRINGAARTGRAGRDGVAVVAGRQVVEWRAGDGEVQVHDLREYSDAHVTGGCVIVGRGDNDSNLCVYAKDEELVARWLRLLRGHGIRTDSDRSEAGVLTCRVLGGTGFSVVPGEIVQFRFADDGVTLLRPRSEPLVFDYVDISTFEIGGPGAVTSGGGFIGGGFGVEGALEGIAIASVLNSLTTKTKIFTTIQLATHHGEIFLLYDKLEPSALRIALSRVFVRLRELDVDATLSRLERLQALHDAGALSPDEFARLRALTLPGAETAPTVV